MTDKIPGITQEINKLLEELTISEIRYPVDENNEVTASMLSSGAGIAVSTAHRRLKQLEKTGVLISRVAKDKDGKRVTAYRKKE